jgi:hypothetical protein
MKLTIFGATPGAPVCTWSRRGSYPTAEDDAAEQQLDADR